MCCKHINSGNIITIIVIMGNFVIQERDKEYYNNM